MYRFVNGIVAPGCRSIAPTADARAIGVWWSAEPYRARAVGRMVVVADRRTILATLALMTRRVAQRSLGREAQVLRR